MAPDVGIEFAASDKAATTVQQTDGPQVSACGVGDWGRGEDEDIDKNRYLDFQELQI